MGLQVLEVLADKRARKTVAFANIFQLSKQAFFYIESAASDRFKLEDRLSRFFDGLDTASA